MEDLIHGMAHVLVKEPDPRTGKPYLHIVVGDRIEICLTLTLAEMIGAAAVGARQRFEELGRYYDDDRSTKH